MARTYRRKRPWICPSECENRRLLTVWTCKIHDRYQWVRDREAPGWHCRGQRREKRNQLRAWRHANKIRVRKGLDPERYDRVWLD